MMKMRTVAIMAAVVAALSACGADQPTPLVETLPTGRYLWVDPEGNVVKIVSVVGSERQVTHATYRTAATPPNASIAAVSHGSVLDVAVGGCAPVAVTIGDGVGRKTSSACPALPAEAMTLLDADPEQPSINVSEY